MKSDGTTGRLQNDSKTIEEDAARWVVLRSSALGAQREAIQAQLDVWLASDPRHQGAFVRAQAVWYELDRLTALSAGARPSRTLPQERLVSRRSVLFAGFSVAAAASAGWYFQYGRVRTPAELAFQSQIGEIRHLRLRDGSRVDLNTDSRAVVRFGARQREVDLTAGEAFFQVVADAREFIVRAGQIVVGSTETAFAVRLNGADTVVTVTAGVVELTHAVDAWSRRVDADSVATVTADGAVKIQRLSSEEAARHLAWREGRVSFAGEPLSVAIAEINRHTHTRIVLDDPSRSGHPIIGSFKANDAATFALVTAAALDLQVVEDGESIHLTTRSASSN